VKALLCHLAARVIIEQRAQDINGRGIAGWT